LLASLILGGFTGCKQQELDGIIKEAMKSDIQKQKELEYRKKKDAQIKAKEFAKQHPESDPVAIKCVMRDGVKTKDQAKEWLLYGMERSNGKTYGSLYGDFMRTGFKDWKKNAFYEVSEEKEWKK